MLRDGRSRARLSVSAAFFLFAAVVGNWAPRVPAVKERADLGNDELGIALLALAAGFLAGTRIAPAAMARWGSAAVVRAATHALCLSLLGPALARDLPTLAGALALMGALGGICDVGINTQGVLVERAQGRPLMSGLHALWSVGAMAAGGAAAAAAAAGVSVVAHFASAGLLLLVVSVASLRWLVPGGQAADAPRTSAAGARRRLGVALLGVIAFAGFIAEGAAADWSAVYLRDELGAPPGVAALGFTVFAAAMAAARFAGDAVVARLGPVVVARVGALVAALGLGAALLVEAAAAALLGFALLGVGVGPVVPLAFSAAGNVDRSSRVLGRVVMMGYVGSIVGPAAIGFAAARIGLRAALVLPAALALAAALCAGEVRAAGTAS